MAFREASGLTGPGPSTGPWRAVLKAVGEDQASLDRWKAAVKEWQLRGYSMRNYAGMLDWHDKGVPPRGSPREVKAQLDAQAAEQEAKEAQARALKQWEAHNVHTSDV